MAVPPLFRFGKATSRWDSIRLRSLLVAVLGSAAAFGWLSPIDQLLFDRMMRLRAGLLSGAGEAAPPRVVLVETPKVDAPRLGEIVREVEAFDPAGIVVTRSERAPHEIVARVPLVVAHRVPSGAREVAPMPAPGDRAEVEPVEAWSLGGAAPDGVHRCQLAGARVGDVVRPGLEVAAARAAGVEFDRPEPCFGIAFRGGEGTLPKVSSTRVLEGGLVRDLIDGRWVLIGPAAADALHGVRTPTTSVGARMSLLEFQGHALDTLLRGEVVRGLTPVGAFVLLLGVALLMTSVEPLIRTRWLLIFVGLVAAVLVIGSTGALLMLGLRTPLTAALGLVLLLHIVTLRSRLRAGGQAVSSLTQGLLGRHRTRLLPDSVYLGESPWKGLAEGVETAVGTTRLLLLERREDGALVELFARGCSIEDLDPADRSVTAAVFERALEKGELHGVADPLLAPRDGESQGVLHLSFAGESVGFWLWSAPLERARARGFETLVRNFGAQIAEVVYHRRRVGSAMTRDEAGLAVRQGVGEAFSTLEWIAVMLERRLLRFEILLRGLGSSVVVFDLLGRVRDVTDTLLERLGRDGISPHQLSAVDLVGRLARIEREEARAALNEALSSSQPVTLPAYIGSDVEASTVMILTAIEVPVDPQGPLASAVRAPQGVLGVSLELLETSSMQALSEVKSQLTERLGDQLARDLEEMGAALHLLRSSEGGAALRDQVMTIVDDKMKGLENLVDECRQYLAIDVSEMGRSRYPVELRTRIQRIAEERRDAADRRRVELQVALPEHVGQVLASSLALDNGVRSVLDFLLEDAEPSTPIWARVFESTETTQVLFSNRGSGYVQEELVDIVASGRESERPVDRAVAAFAEQVSNWGGTLRVESHIGVGTQFELNLARSKHL